MREPQQKDLYYLTILVHYLFCTRALKYIEYINRVGFRNKKILLVYVGGVQSIEAEIVMKKIN